MNQAQRTFLINKIDHTVKTRVDALKKAIPDAPSLNNYLLHAVMSNNFELITIEQLKEIIRQKALKSKEREDWLGNSWSNASKRQVIFEADELFVVPDEYKVQREEYRKEKQRIDNEIADILIQGDTLKTRIQLASDKTLQTMINEVDDMGDISLLDNKLKLLTNKS